MNRYFLLILINLALLLGYYNYSILEKESILKNGDLILLKLAPVDPRSIMQGDYMNLNYEATTGVDKSGITSDGYVILLVDDNRVGSLVRFQEKLEPIHSNEYAIRYRFSSWGIKIGAESYFFQEGHAPVYEKAVYGGLRVDKKGNSILVGLYDADFTLLKNLDGIK